MSWTGQHWVALLVIAVVFFYVGRKTTLGNGLPYIG